MRQFAKSLAEVTIVAEAESVVLIRGGYRIESGRDRIVLAGQETSFRVTDAQTFVLDEMPPAVLDLLGKTKGEITDALGEFGVADQMLTWVSWRSE